MRIWLFMATTLLVLQSGAAVGQAVEAERNRIVETLRLSCAQSVRKAHPAKSNTDVERFCQCPRIWFMSLAIGATRSPPGPEAMTIKQLQDGDFLAVAKTTLANDRSPYTAGQYRACLQQHLPEPLPTIADGDPAMLTNFHASCVRAMPDVGAFGLNKKTTEAAVIEARCSCLKFVANYWAKRSREEPAGNAGRNLRVLLTGRSRDFDAGLGYYLQSGAQPPAATCVN